MHSAAYFLFMSLGRPRLVFFATQLYPLAVGRPSGFGGAETEMWNVARGLAEDSIYDVQALTLTDETTEPVPFENLMLHPISPGVVVTYRTFWFRRRLAISSYFIRLFRALIRQRGSIYFSKLASREAAAVYLASRVVGGKYIFRVEHDWETNLHDLTHNIFSGSRFSPRILIFCLKHADLVVAQTQNQVEALAANYGVHAVIIPNGHVIPPESAIIHDPEQRRTVVWIGRAHPMKRPMLFLDLAHKHQDFEFLMIMAPSAEHPDLLEATRARAEALPNVRFFPGVSPAEVNKHLETARVFVLTSEAEGFSNVLIEAMKNGVPALSLAHNPNDLLHVLSPNGIPPPSPGFYAADSMDSCSRLLQLLSNDRQFWENCHYKAIAFANDMFGLKSVLQQYRVHFTKLLDKN